MNSYIKTYVFFLGVLIFSIIFILKPSEDFERIERNQEEIVTLEVSDFMLYSVIDEKPEMKIKGKKGMQFSDREEFWDFFLTNYNTQVGGLQALKAKNNEENFFVTHGIKRKDSYTFDSGVKYSNADGMRFEAVRGVYDLKKRIFQTEGEFEAKTQEGIFRGENLYYDANSEELKARSLRGKIWLED